MLPAVTVTLFSLVLHFLTVSRMFWDSGPCITSIASA